MSSKLRACVGERRPVNAVRATLRRESKSVVEKAIAADFEAVNELRQRTAESRTEDASLKFILLFLPNQTAMCELATYLLASLA